MRAESKGLGALASLDLPAFSMCSSTWRLFRGQGPQHIGAPSSSCHLRAKKETQLEACSSGERRLVFVLVPPSSCLVYLSCILCSPTTLGSASVTWPLVCYHDSKEIVGCALSEVQGSWRDPVVAQNLTRRPLQELRRRCSGTQEGTDLPCFCDLVLRTGVYRWQLQRDAK